MSKKTTPLIAMGFIVVVCLALRFPLLHIHGMMQWPIVLAALCIATILLTMGWNNDLISIMAADGYVMGFLCGLLFQSDGVDAGGGRTNNMWLIWTVIMLGFIIFAVLLTYFKRKNRTKR